RQAHVLPDGDPPGLELLDVRAPDGVRPLFVEFVRIDPSNVVRLEDLGVEHGPDANRPVPTASRYMQGAGGIVPALVFAMSPWFPPRSHEAFFHSLTARV